jgi:hypothetical protein
MYSDEIDSKLPYWVKEINKLTELYSKKKEKKNPKVATLPIEVPNEQ